MLILALFYVGGDDRRVLLWHMERAIHSRVKPMQLKGEHHSNIFCLAFNSGNTRVFSGGKEGKLNEGANNLPTLFLEAGLPLVEHSIEYNMVHLLQEHCL